MNYRECTQFANKCRTVFVATVDGTKPRVRPLALQFADERGFYFQTEPVKALCEQLRVNKNIELCFYDSEAEGLGTVMRVNGEAEFVHDLTLKAQLLDEKPFLKLLGIQEPDDPLFVLFRVNRGEAFFWTMADNMRESQIRRLTFECP